MKLILPGTMSGSVVCTVWLCPGEAVQPPSSLCLLANHLDLKVHTANICILMNINNVYISIEQVGLVLMSLWARRMIISHY